MPRSIPRIVVLLSVWLVTFSCGSNDKGPSLNVSENSSTGQDSQTTDQSLNAIYCTSNVQCSLDRYCPPAECEGCDRVCTLHGCGTEDEATCATIRPDCVDGNVSVILNGCWVCISLDTCVNNGIEDAVPQDAMPTDVMEDSIPPQDQVDSQDNQSPEDVLQDQSVDAPEDIQQPDDVPAPEDIYIPDDITGPIEGTWYDPESGLRWENPGSDDRMSFDEAGQRCADLTTGGLTDWRMPTISELRGLIAGCMMTVTEGSCKVTDDCAQSSCAPLGCSGCTEYLGPEEGCYWLPELVGPCEWVWSSSGATNMMGVFSWCVVFKDGAIRQGNHIVLSDSFVRCVR